MNEKFLIAETDEVDMGNKLRSINEIAHRTLDELLTNYMKPESFGGFTLIEGTRLDGSVAKFKLVFVDVSEQEDCDFCGGSGLVGGSREEV